MSENRAWGAVSLEQLAADDWERQQRRAALVANVKRRRGNKGSRVWGYQAAGAGKRRRK